MGGCSSFIDLSTSSSTSTHCCDWKNFNPMVFGSNPIVGALSPVNFHLHDEIIETCVHSPERFIWIEIAHFYFIRTFDRKVYLTTLNENVVRERCDDTLWNYILCISTYIGKASKISNLHDINDKSMTTKKRYKLRTSWSIEHVYKQWVVRTDLSLQLVGHLLWLWLEGGLGRFSSPTKKPARLCWDNYRTVENERIY